jgi:hypothetical protein
MKPLRMRPLGLAAVAGLFAAALVRITRLLPLVQNDAPNDGDGSKKDRKKDFKKMGSGPRTRRKKAKKGR